LIYRLRRGPSFFVGGTPIIIALVVLGATQSAGFFEDMSLIQASASGFSFGMGLFGAFLFWSEDSWPQ